MALDSQWLNWLMCRTKTLLFLQHRQPSTHIFFKFSKCPSFQRFPENMKFSYEEKKAQHLFQDLTLICVFNFFQQITSSILPLRKTWKKQGDTSSSMMRSTSQLAWMKCVSTDRFTVPCQIEGTVASFKLSQFHLTNEVCVSAVFCYYSFRMILKDLTFVQNSLSSPVASYFSYHFFAEHPIWSNLLLTSICSVWFSTQVPNVHFIL